MHIFYIIILSFDVFYMFRTLVFIYRNTVVYTVTVRYILHVVFYVE